MLTNKAIEILKLLNKSDYPLSFLINKTMLSPGDTSKILSDLVRKRYISKVNASDVHYGRAEDVIYSITINGRAKIENIILSEAERGFDKRHVRINTVIAVTALLFAIPALILSLMQLFR